MISPITQLSPMNFGIVSAIEPLMPAAALRDMQDDNNNQQIQAAGGGVTFADMLKQLIDNVNVTSAQANLNAGELAWGLTDTALHNIEIDAMRADLALRTLTSVRNKVLEAYTEIMRITV